jgi:hypothetical protein
MCVAHTFSIAHNTATQDAEQKKWTRRSTVYIDIYK